jgi:DNA-binding transcriptional ArsR family regulator
MDDTELAGATDALTGPVPDVVVDFCRLSGVLAVPNRLALLALLADGRERDVQELARVTRMPQPTVTHHLNVLRGHRLVESRRDGRFVRYRVGGDAAAAAAGGGGRLTFQLAGAAVVVDLNALPSPTPPTRHPAP